MNHPYPHPGIAPPDHAALIDAARLRAERLRREAIGDMWTAVARALRRAWHGAARAAHGTGPVARPPTTCTH